jgi:hypothetical protein
MTNYTRISIKYCLVFYLMTTLLQTPCLGQKKFEREYGVKADAVPTSATSFVSSLFPEIKVNWYIEESPGSKSIEAKFNHSEKRYSVEFDESGKIQDIEILIKIKNVEKKVRTSIKNNISTVFRRHKIVKAQLQWMGDADSLRQSVLIGTPEKSITTKYELVVRGKKDKVEGYFEVLCDSDGVIERITELLMGNHDNLIY